MAKLTTATDQADRIALIKEVAERFNKKIKRNNKVRKSETHYMDKYDNGNNINAWTDERSYANEYYGERMRQTTFHDNDWD